MELETIINASEKVDLLSRRNTGIRGRTTRQGRHMEDEIRDRQPFVAETSLRDPAHFHQNRRAQKTV